MSTGRKVPLIELPIDTCRGLGCLEVIQQGQKISLPLAGVDIKAKVADRVASVTVKQTFKNSYTEHLEAVYIFPLSGNCAVSEFQLKVGDRVIKGVVEERAQARQQYQQAIDSGKRAALLEQERDDVFTVQVGNLPPGEEVTVLLTYSERLPFFEDGKTEIRLPLVVAPRYIPGDELGRGSVGDGTEQDTNVVQDASRITPPRLADGVDPNTALSIEVEVMQADDSGTTGISGLSCSQHAMELGLENGGVKVTLAKDNERLNRDFVLQWRLTSAKVKSTMLMHKGADGTNYAMLSILPPKRDGFLGAPRDVLFVLDRSGSMEGPKMISAARACSILLSTLGPQDRFAIQAFDNVSEWMLPQGTSSRNNDYFMPADEVGIERGHKYLRGITARGGTEMYGALGEALNAIAERKKAKGRVPVIVLMTDGEVGDEGRILKRIQQELGDSRLFTVGIDTAVNSGLLKRCANLGGGTATFVVPGTQLENALLSVGREIGAPLVIDLEIETEDGKESISAIAPQRVPDLFSGRAVTVFFKLPEKASVRVHGKFSDGAIFNEKVKAKRVDLPSIAQLWAKTHITDLEDQYRLGQGNDTKARQHMIDLAVQHSLLTKFTAFVVVDESEVVNKSGNVRKVVQPVETPAEWSEAFRAGSLGVSFGAAAMPQMQRMRAMPSSAPSGGGWDSGASWGALPPGAPASPAPSQAQNFPAGSPRAEMDQLSCSESAGDSWGGDAQPQMQSGSSQPFAGGGGGSYGSGVRAQVFEVVVRQAIEGAPWREICAGPMQVNNISEEEVIQEVARRGHKLKPAGDPAELARIKTRLDRFEELLKAAYDAIKSGTVPDASDIEIARKKLMESLATSPVGTKIPELQKFLRSAAVELISSINEDSATVENLKPLWDRHMKTFTEAHAAATNQLDAEGLDASNNFWEASI
jgi:Ca-activated chloride channel homolog